MLMRNIGSSHIRSQPANAMGIGHNRECDRCGGDGRQDAGIDGVDPLPAGGSAKCVALERIGLGAHREGSSAVEPAAGFGNLQHRGQGDSA